jgi:hypothetical protein
VHHGFRGVDGAWGGALDEIVASLVRRSEMDELRIDRKAMGQLANALAFICGADHPTVVAMKKAVASGTERDIKDARTNSFSS